MRRELVLLLDLLFEAFEREDLDVRCCCCVDDFFRSGLRLSEIRRVIRLLSLLLFDVVSNTDESSERLSDRELASLLVDCPDSLFDKSDDEPDELVDDDLSREEVDDRAPLPCSDASSSMFVRPALVLLPILVERRVDLPPVVLSSCSTV